MIVMYGYKKRILWIVCFSYLLGIQALCQDMAWKSKLDPLIRNLLRMETDLPPSHVLRSRKNQKGESVLGCFVQTDNFETLQRIGIDIRARAGDIGTAFIPITRIEEVAGLPCVVYLEAGKPGKCQLDISMPEIGMDGIRIGALGHNFQGEGILIGIYDSGIDWSHPDFIDSEGHTRIYVLWDQTIDDGPSPAYEGMDYGTVFTQEQINDALSGNPGIRIEGLDLTGHGTHVAGIAAGNGLGVKNGKSGGVYTGAAPKAGLIVVKGGDEQFYSDDIFDGISFMFQKAAEYEPPRPIAVNLSVGGTHKGPHDGTSLFERGIDELLNWETGDGKAIVISAGNDGNRNIHFSGSFSPGVDADTVMVEFEVASNFSDIQDYVSFDIWYYWYSSLSITIQTPSGLWYGPVESGTSLFWDTVDGDISIDNASYGSGDDEELVMNLYDSMTGESSSDNLATGTWLLQFIGRTGRFDGWLYESSMGAEIISQKDFSMLVAEPANCRFGISVGSYVTRLNWPSLVPKLWQRIGSEIGNLSNFSSPGPTRDGRNKPDITAPGEFILSTLSGELDISGRTYLVADDSMHWALRGTSMAAPHVTGVIGLMFEADAELNSSEILDLFIQSSRQDGFTGETWNPYWGFGKLDAYEALKTITSVPWPHDPAPDSFYILSNYPNPFNEKTIISYAIPVHSKNRLHKVKIQILDIHGRLITDLFHGFQRPGFYEIVWDGRDAQANQVASGVYLFRIIMDQHILCGKMAYVR
jgi:minor extracellular serine protease Vpr